MVGKRSKQDLCSEHVKFQLCSIFVNYPHINNNLNNISKLHQFLQCIKDKIFLTFNCMVVSSGIILCK